MRCESESCLPRFLLATACFFRNKLRCGFSWFPKTSTSSCDSTFAKTRNVEEEEEAENDNAVQTVHLRDEVGQQHQDEEDIFDMDEVRVPKDENLADLCKDCMK